MEKKEIERWIQLLKDYKVYLRQQYEAYYKPNEMLDDMIRVRDNVKKINSKIKELEEELDD